MIIQKQFLNKLKDLGLNTYEVKLWTALLSRGISTAGELSDIASVPRSRTYDVLESLEKKGFIIMKIGKPIKYIAVHPEEVIERVKKRVSKDAEVKAKMLDNIKKSDVLKELNLLHDKGIKIVDPLEFIGVLKGRNNIYNHLEMLIKNAKKSIVLITTPNNFEIKLNFLKNTFKKAKQKGVKIKIATQIRKEHKKLINELKGFIDIKNTNETSRFCVVDEKDIIFMLTDNVHPSFDIGVWVKSDLFASKLQKMFENDWNSMGSVDKVLK